MELSLRTGDELRLVDDTRRSLDFERPQRSSDLRLEVTRCSKVSREVSFLPLSDLCEETLLSGFAVDVG
jgi:hypothetical protein